MIIQRAVLPLLLFTSFTAMSEEISESERQARLSGEGMQLDAKSAQAIEDRLKNKPDDLDSHIELLGYYQFKKDQYSQADYVRHALWLIQNAPEEPSAGGPFMMQFSERDFPRIEEAWAAQVEKHPDNPKILGHAASLYVHTKPEKAEKWLLKAMELDPKEIEWAESLSRSYERLYRHAKGKERIEAAKKALGAYEKAYGLATDEQRFYMLDSLANAAFEAEDMEKASKYALDVLKQAPNYTKDWNYGNAIYYGNFIQGQIALRKGDTKEALKFLLEAGKTRGSPQLDTFGPDLSLAAALLEKGEKDGVLEFLASCRKFWEMGQKRIDRWTAEIKEGKTPNFKDQKE